MSEPMPTIPTQSPFTYPNPNPSASPLFTQDDTSESFIPKPTQPMPTFTQTDFHMPDFHHYDDARDIWMAVKARFGRNEESKKMRKTMLKQQFTEFSVTEPSPSESKEMLLLQSTVTFMMHINMARELIEQRVQAKGIKIVILIKGSGKTSKEQLSSPAAKSTDKNC
ncbi:hypothetical protein Tco_1430967 [Tanacetum coccineum]